MGTTESECLLGGPQGRLVQLRNLTLGRGMRDSCRGIMASEIGWPPQRAEAGGFLLEALIALLIFLVGILCVVATQAHSLRAVNDAHYRAEAAYLASRLLAQMWADNQSILKIKYDSTLGGPGYSAFQSEVGTLPGASLKSPDVVFDDALAPSANSNFVAITVYWRAPGEDLENGNASFWHSYTMSGVVGQN